jgi:hypothetical protein
MQATGLSKRYGNDYHISFSGEPLNLGVAKVVA